MLAILENKIVLGKPGFIQANNCRFVSMLDVGVRITKLRT